MAREAWAPRAFCRSDLCAPLRSFFDSVETEKRGKAPFEQARPLREALDRNEKRSRAEASVVPLVPATA
jgi:hypothetical protein